MDPLGTIHPSPVVISRAFCRITPLSGPQCCPRPFRAGAPHVREPNPVWDGLGRPGMAFVRCGTTPGDPSHHSKSIRHQLTTPNALHYSISLKKVALAFDCASAEGLLSLLPGGGAWEWVFSIRTSENARYHFVCLREIIRIS